MARSRSTGSVAIEPIMAVTKASRCCSSVVTSPFGASATMRADNSTVPRVITIEMLANPCRLARCKAFFGHGRQPGGEPVLHVQPPATIEREGWILERGAEAAEALAETKWDLFFAAAHGRWPAALPMKDADQEPCASCPWPRFTIGMQRGCDDNAAWQGKPPSEVAPGIQAMMRRD